MVPSANLFGCVPKNRLLLLLAAVLFTAIGANAQAVGSSRGLASGDGNHIIQGRLYFPPGQSVASKVVKVTLESSNSAGGQSTTSDEDGTFRFNGLRAGNYYVIVEGGQNYESGRESVSIDPTGTSAAAIQVNIQLRPRVGASNPAFAGVPKEALAFYQQGTAAAQKGNAKGAVELLGKAVTAYPNFAMALSELGSQYLKLLDWGKAAETFEALIKLKPDDAAAHLDLGIALYNLSGPLLTDKKVEEANQKLTMGESHLREALKLKINGPSAHYYLGMTLIKLRRFEDAQSELEAAIKNGGDGIALAHRFLGGLYQSQHRNKEAADELETYLRLDPKAKDADTIKGIIEKLRGQ